MSERSNLKTGRSNKSSPQYLGFLVAGSALVVLAGWQFNSQVLTRLGFKIGSEHPMAAISFLAIGLFFITKSTQGKSFLNKALNYILPLIPILIGSIKTLEIFFHLPTHIDSLLYASELTVFGINGVPSHITASTSILILLTGVVLFLMNFDSKRLHVLLNDLAGFIGLIALLSFISSVFLDHDFHLVVFYTGMAIPAVICFLISSVAIMLSHPNSGYVVVFTGNYPGSRKGRIFLPLSLFIPIFFAIATVLVLRHSIFASQIGMTLLALSLILTMFILTWYLGGLINKTNLERLAAENLRKSEFYYRSIIENASDPIMIINMKGEFSEVNSSASDLFGYSKDEFLKLNIRQLIEPEQLKIDPVRFDLISANKPFVRERRMITKNGSIIEASSNIKILPDGRVLAIFHDITEKKQEEIEFRNLFEQLQLSETKFRNAFEYSAIGMALVSLDGRLMRVNKQFSSMLGYTEHELLSKTFRDFTHPEDFDKNPELMVKKFRGEIDEFSIEKRYFHKNGSIVWVQISSTLLRDANSKPLYFVSQIENTTERKNAESELRESEEKYRSLISRASDAIWVIDFSGNFIEVNTTLCNMLGYTKEELVAQHLSKIVDPEQLKIDPLKYDLPADGRTILKERRMIRKDGSILTAEWHVKRISDNQIMTIARDISELRKAQKQLKQSEARFRALVENNFDAITLLDKNFRPIYRSPSTQRVTGWLDEERKDNDGVAILHPDDVIPVQEIYKKIMENEGVPFTHSYRIKHKDGYYIWVESISRNMLNDPDIGAIVVILRDITERKNAEQELSRSEAKFRALVENNFDSLTLYDKNLNAFYRSPSSEKVTGWTNDERKQHPPFYIVHPDDVEKVKGVFENTLSNSQKSFSLTYRLKHTNGNYIWIESVTRNMLDDTNIGAIVNIFHDVTEKKNAELRLIKSNRELFMLNHISDVIVRYKDENALMNQTCRLLADYGNYSLAWIGLGPDARSEDRRVITVTKAGKAIKYLESLKLNLDDERTKNGPVATALNTGRMKIINRFDDDPFFEPWSKAAKENGLASLICLPFDISEKKRGVLAIYSTQPDAFDRDEVTILQRIVENLGYAVRSIRTMKERDQAIQQIIKSEEKYRLLFESNPLPMWISSIPDIKIIDVNDAAIKHYGYSREEFIGMNMKDLRPTEDVEKFLKSVHIQRTGINNMGAWRHTKKNGETINVEIFTHEILYDGKSARLILISDITEKLKAEDELRKMNEQLRYFSAHLQDIREEERIHIAREIHDELGQLLTGLKIDVSWLSKKLISHPDELTNRVDEMLMLTDRTIQSVRKIATELRPGILDDLGLEEAIIWQANEFQNKTGIRCEIEGGLNVKKYSPEISTAAFRIMQESLTNIMRHANAKNVKIKMQESDNLLHLEIIDDGVGLVFENQNGSKSLGIMGMRERASIIGGSFVIHSEPFKGTKIEIDIPVKYVS